MAIVKLGETTPEAASRALVRLERLARQLVKAGDAVNAATVDAAMADIRAIRQVSQGADYVMVPREPTDEMVWAGRDAWTAAHHAMKAGESRYPMTETWRAMIAAYQDQEGGANG